MVVEINDTMPGIKLNAAKRF